MKQIQAVNQVLDQKLYNIFDSHFTQIFESIISKNSKYNANDIIRPTIMASLENTSIEDICEEYEVCSADTVQRRINQLDFSDLEKKIQEMIQILFKSFGIHKNQKITLLIDITEFLYYGKELIPISTGTKPKNNTHKSIQFFTASILTETYIIPIFLKTITKDYPRKPGKLIQDLIRSLSEDITISRIIGDSYFFNHEVHELLKSQGIEYIFNLKEYKTIKRDIQGEVNMRITLAKIAGVDTSNPKKLLRWLKKNKLDNFKFETSYESYPDVYFTVVIQLIVTKKKNKDKKVEDTLIWFSYVSNIPISVKYITELYKKRWGIETHYRIERQFLAKTCSKSSNYRLLLFGLSLLFDSLWLILNALLNRQKVSNSNLVVNLDCIKIYSYDVLLMTVKRFIRRLTHILKETVGFKK